MSDLAQTAVSTETEVSAEKSIWCPESSSAIFGTQLVSEKLLNIIRMVLLTEEDHGINTVRFTEDLPKVIVLNEQDEETGEYADALANYDFENRGVTVNIQGHLKTAVKRIVEGTKIMRIGAFIHANLLLSILHELFESHKLIDASNPYLVDVLAHDDECERLAKELLVEIAKTTNIEAPALAEESDIIRTFITEFEEDALTSNEPWAEPYRKLIEKNLIYIDGESEIATLRLYYKRYAEGTGTADEWPEEVVEVATEQFNAVAGTPATITAPVVTSAPPAQVVDDQTVLSHDFDFDYGEVGEMPSFDGGAPTVTPAPTANSPAPVPGQTPTVGQYTGMENIPSGPVMPAPVGLPAGTPAPAQGTSTPTLPVHNLSPDQKLLFIKELCLRMYDYLFGYCQFTPNPQANPQAPHMGFGNPMAIYGFVPVTDIPFAKEILVGVKTIDEKTGQEIEVDIWNPQVAGWLPGHIRGVVWSKGTYTTQCPLPGYKIVINLDGVKQERTFAPQNPNKMVGQQGMKSLGKWAQEARNGVMRALLLDDKRDRDNKIQITVTTVPDGTKVREVMSNPLNQSLRRIL